MIAFRGPRALLPSGIVLAPVSFSSLPPPRRDILTVASSALNKVSHQHNSPGKYSETTQSKLQLWFRPGPNAWFGGESTAAPHSPVPPRCSPAENVVLQAGQLPALPRPARPGPPSFSKHATLINKWKSAVYGEIHFIAQPTPKLSQSFIKISLGSLTFPLLITSHPPNNIHHNPPGLLV